MFDVWSSGFLFFGMWCVSIWSSWSSLHSLTCLILLMMFFYTFMLFLYNFTVEFDVASGIHFHIPAFREEHQDEVMLAWQCVDGRLSAMMTALVCLSVWFRLKYLNNYWMDCDEIWFRHSSSPQHELYWLCWSSDFSSSAIIRSKFSLYLLNGLVQNVLQPEGWRSCVLVKCLHSCWMDRSCKLVQAISLFVNFLSNTIIRC